MRARVVDWSLLTLVGVGIITGLWSFLVGDPQGRLVFIAHGALGMAIIGVLIAKVRRVTPVVLSAKGGRRSMAAGVLTTVAALLTVLLGVWWVVMQTPTNYPNGMILHTTMAFILLGFSLWHLRLRFRPLKKRDLQDRRSMLRLIAILLGGGVVWAGVESGQRVFGSVGSHRRFTGSRLEGDGKGSDFPVTMWMFDRPDVINIEQSILEVGGAVTTPLRFAASELAQLPQSSLYATLDCTGGWYTEQEWYGIAVAELMAQAEPKASATTVRFRSVTGYRWSLPLAEAAQTLLATHVGGRPLSHGHGAPLRLVAPGRRGFQWVKWVVAVEVLDVPDMGQWGAIFTSGLDGA
jgi:hypothetical protein